MGESTDKQTLRTTIYLISVYSIAFIISMVSLGYISEHVGVSIFPDISTLFTDIHVYW